MGMFTTIIHPKDGRELQIKTGDDSCDTYKLGDTVKWYVNKDRYGSGCLFDGIYSSYSKKGDDDDWVVIKDHKVFAIRSRKNNSYQSLVKKYNIKDPPSNLWTKEAKIRYLKMMREITEENRKFNESIKHLSKEEQFIQRVVKSMIGTRINYAEIGRKLIDVQELPSNKSALIAFWDKKLKDKNEKEKKKD